MRRFLLLLSSLLACSPLLAQQAPTWRWSRLQTLGTSAGTVSNTCLRTDAQGNTYVAGFFIGAVVLTPSVSFISLNSAGADGYVAKYDPAGTLLWAQQLAGPADESPRDMAVDAAGNVYLTGAFTASLKIGSNLPLTGGTQVRTYVAKLNAQGQLQWQRQDGFGPGTSGGSFPSGLGLDAAGNLFLTGRSTGTAAFGTFTLTAPNSTMYLVKYDAQGVAQWARQGNAMPTPSGVTYIQSLVVSPAGESYLTWANNPTYGGFGATPLPAGFGDLDVALVKYDAQGNLQWLYLGGGTGPDLARNAALDGAGHLNLSLQFSGAATFGATTLLATGTRSSALLQLNTTTGTVNWAQPFLSTASASYQGLGTDAAGNVYVAGSFTGAATLGAQVLNASGTDAVVASYTPQGALRWTQQASGTGDEVAGLLAVHADGSLAVGGDLRGPAQFGGLAVAGRPDYDGFVALLSDRLTAAHTAQVAQPLALYPNPARQQVRLQLPGRSGVTQATLTVRNALGQTVRTQPLTLPAGGQAEVPLAALAPGLYTLQVQDQTQLYRQRLIVE